jgi:glycosyltransferase involved in cell wall biosynthesis
MLTKKLKINKPVIQFENRTSNNPLVSIIILAYNHEYYIKKCLDSVLEQKTNFEYEILLGEDESSDDTRSICIEYAEKFNDKIKLFLHSRENVIKKKGKPTGRFNFLYSLNKAKGKYIAICEGDDYWTDSLKLQKQVDFLEENKDFVYCSTNLEVLNQNTHTFSKTDAEKLISNKTVHDSDLEGFLDPYIWYTCTILFRHSTRIKNSIGKIYKFKHFKDIFLLSILLEEGKCRFVNESSSVYRVHEDGLWSMISNYRKTYDNNQTFKSMAYYHHGKVKLINESYLYGLIDLYNSDATSKFNRFLIVINFLAFCIYTNSYLNLFKREILKIR